MMPFDDSRQLANTGKGGSSQRIIEAALGFRASTVNPAAGASNLFPGDQPSR